MSDEKHNQGAHGAAEGGEHKKHKKHHPHRHEEHEHEEGWIVSFADNALLQMGFFVILLALNMGEKAKGPADPDGPEGGAAMSAAMLDGVISIREAFNNPVTLDSKNANDLPLVQRLRERAGSGDATDQGTPGQKQRVQATPPTNYTAPTGTVGFEQGSAQISSAARRTLESVAGQIAGGKWVIEVRGHASAIEGRSGVDASMRLSYERALAAATVLNQHRVPWANIRVVACGDNDRYSPSASSAGFGTNSRAEIIVTREPMAEDPFLRGPTNGQ
ncbi:MAG: hypothetical protein C0475_00170 [Planctomyces sp.]|nr:hypothetical protein [Planctomyces sp.]